MKTVKSDDLGVSITGNMITHHSLPYMQVGTLLLSIPNRQFSIIPKNDSEGNTLYDLSYPMQSKEHRQYAGLIHRLNAENKLGKKFKPTENGPNDDGTPPSGGTPGTPVLAKLEFVEAIAA